MITTPAFRLEEDIRGKNDEQTVALTEVFILNTMSMTKHGEIRMIMKCSNGWDIM